MFKVKDPRDEAFTVLAQSGATRFLLEGNRIALEANGELRVKDGIHGEWRLFATEPVRQFALEGQRIGVHYESGLLRVKDGIDGAWHELPSTAVREFQLQGNRIGRLLANGVLSVRVGPTGADMNTEPFGAGVTQFRLLVDNPVAPYRTTPSSYATGQSRCRELDAADGDPIFGEEDCYPALTHIAFPVPFYGVWCGAGRPNDLSQAARERGDRGGFGGPIDSFDALCMHHDPWESWYPELAGWDTDLTQSCIVRYGLRNGRLTHNGTLLANGWSDSTTWNAAWENAGMANMRYAIEVYFNRTFTCSDSDLAEFDRLTDASH
jgi:hypothetical protein